MEIRGQDQPPDIELVLSSYFNLELRKKNTSAGEGGGGEESRRHYREKLLTFLDLKIYMLKFCRRVVCNERLITDTAMIMTVVVRIYFVLFKEFMMLLSLFA